MLQVKDSLKDQDKLTTLYTEKARKELAPAGDEFMPRQCDLELTRSIYHPKSANATKKRGQMQSHI
jgi:hypothetical protein